MIDIAALLHKIRSAPQRLGTFDRGDPKPLDEYRVVLTGEERDWLVAMADAKAARIDDHTTRARRMMKDHVSLGVVLHQDRMMEDIAVLSQQSFDLGFRAAGGEIDRLKRTSGEG